MHTNGPWTIPETQWDEDSPEEFRELIRIADANGKYDVAYAANDIHRMQGNAKLIAVAPEMLDVLKQAKTWLEGWGSAEAEIAAINAVLAKAE